MTAGASGTILTNPLWVVKTRFMTQESGADEPRYRHTWDALVRIYREEGPKAFYRGLLPSLFGVAHVAVQFPLYERFKVMSRTYLESLASRRTGLTGLSSQDPRTAPTSRRRPFSSVHPLRR